MEKDAKPAQEAATDSIILEEEIDPNYVPSEPEIIEYAKWLGMDLEKDKDLFWIAKEGLSAPLPKDWKPCKTKDTEDVYYFNFATGESTWDHPCDGYYKRLYEEEKKRKETVIKESGDQNRSKAKQDVEQLLGKPDKKKKKKGVAELGSVDMVKPLPAPLGAQRKPLPDVSTGRLGGPVLGAAPLGKVSASMEVPRLSSFSSLSGSKPLGSISQNQLGPVTDSAQPLARPSSAPASVPAPASDRKAPSAIETAADEKHSGGGSQRSSKQVGDEDDKDTDHELGRINPTAALNTQSRTLKRSSSPTQTARRRSPVNMEPVSDTRYAMEERAGSTAEDKEGRSSGDTDSLLEEVQQLRARCAQLSRQAEESERVASQYQASHAAVKEELQALERRYESSQAQWKDRLRAVEAERDAMDSERRRLKFELLDAQSAGPSQVEPAQLAVGTGSAEDTQALLRDLRAAQAALTRSAATHSELQAQVRDAELRHRERLAQVEAERAAALAECERLTGVLREVQQRVDSAGSLERTSAVRSEEARALSAELERRSDELAAKEAEVRKLSTKLAGEQARCSGLLEQIMAMGANGEEQARSMQTENAALAKRLEETQAKLLAISSEMEGLRAASAADSAAALRRAEEAESRLAVADRQLAEQKVLEGNLRREIVELQRLRSEDQEQLFKVQAERNQSMLSETERGAQFEAFTAQATAVRKSLKAEIEKLKSQLADLETEKSSLVTQLTRQETTLQFAKKELNDAAALKETARQLEAENQSLSAQVEHWKETSTRQSTQEAAAKERYDRLQRTVMEEEQLRHDLRSENSRLSMALESERSLLAQKEKKIKSYQEEILQLQRRLAETSASPTKEVLVEPIQPAQLAELQQQVSDAQRAAASALAQKEAAERQAAVSETERRKVVATAEELRGTCSSLTAQLETRAAELDSCRLALSRLQTEAARSMTERDVEPHEQVLVELKEKILALENEKNILAADIRESRNQISSLTLSLELKAADVKMVEAEVQSYREKWKSSERELSELRLTQAKAAAETEVAVAALQSQLAELQVINDLNARSANDLRFSKQQEVGAVRNALAEKEVQLAAALAELTTLRGQLQQQQCAAAVTAPTTADPVPVPVSVAPARDLRSVGEPVVAGMQLPEVSGGAVHQIVALSMEVGRQQAAMHRMEEHMRNTERLLLEFRDRAQTRSRSSAEDSILPSAIKRKEGRRRGVTAAAPEDGSPESVSLLPQRSDRRRYKPLESKHSDSDSSESPSRVRGSGGGVATVSKQWMAATIREFDLHGFDEVTLEAARGRTQHELAVALVAAKRVAVAGRARLKSEARFLRHLQAQCGKVKAALLMEQDAVKALKARWRAGRGHSGKGGETPSTAAINELTTQVNAAVDELREAQTVLREGERVAHGVSQSLEHLEELISIAEEGPGEARPPSELAARILEVAAAVQQKCANSAYALRSIVVDASQNAGQRSASARSQRALSANSPSRKSKTHRSHDLPPPPPVSRYDGQVFAEVPSPAAAGIGFEDSEFRHLRPPVQGSAAYLSGTLPAHMPASPRRSHSAAAGVTASAAPAGATSGIRNGETRTRILQNQIGAIMQRQSQSREACEKHAGWLDALRREISGVTHSHPRVSVSAASLKNSMGTAQSLKNTKGDKTGPTDFALRFEAAAHFSNSRRAFGDAANREEGARQQAAADVEGGGAVGTAAFLTF